MTSSDGAGELTTALRREGDRVIVAVGGELDLSVTATFLDAIDEAIGLAAGDGEAATSAIELDLVGVSFMDSSGVGTYVDAFRRASARGIVLSIGPRSPAVERVLQLSGVEDALAADGGNTQS